MSENRYGGVSITGNDFSSPEFQAAVRAGGVTMEQATANLRAAGPYYDPAGFEALIAIHRPELWKRMNRRPSRVRGGWRRMVGRIAR